MSFAWLDYVVLAEALLQARTNFAPEEACCRAAISRTYSAVYGTVCSCPPPVCARLLVCPHASPDRPRAGGLHACP